MGMQITIIGLGQIGTSIGLALSGQKDLLQRVGYDQEKSVTRKAKDLGALDRGEGKLRNAVADAGLILLTLPMDQIRQTLAEIAPHLKEGAVVMDTGPVKEVVSAWAGELLPPNRYYVGLTPVLNPVHLQNIDAGIDAARADLFQRGLMAIVAPPHAHADAIKLASDLTRLIGAQPFFVDTAEMDGLMASTHLLPQLLAAGLLNATVDQPGWLEARKVAGRAYAEVSGPMTYLSSPQSLASSAILNQENILRVIDSAIAALQAMHSDIASQNETALAERLLRAQRGRAIWWQQRQAADWSIPEATAWDAVPGSSENLGRLLGLGRKPKQKK
jgi:prephenate dehydrogenase